MPPDDAPNKTLANEPVAGLGSGFAHLHLHSEFSLLDGGNRLDRLVAKVKELGMDSVAITDHGNLFGALAFYETAKASGIKPILGCEAYVAPGDRHDRTFTGASDGGHHLVLLAENDIGWRNLMRLASEAYLTGFYYKPRIDRALLEECNEGLIAINGHLGSELAHHLVEFEKTKDDSHWQHAIEVCEWHRRVLSDTPTGPRFYVELQHHIPEQNIINPHLIRIARKLDLPIVCDNDSHFLTAEEHDAHDTLICISTGKQKSDPNRMHYPHALYVKSPREMRELFDGPDADAMYDAPADWLGAGGMGGLGGDSIGRVACDNTLRIARRCNTTIEYGSHAPLVSVRRPDASIAYAGEADRTAWFKRVCAAYEVSPFDPRETGISTDALKAECNTALRELCEAGLIWRYGDDGITDDVRSRLSRELSILADKGIAPYFLIVWDFVNWARQRGIPAIARGSGVGTMVGYVLGLSNACPVRYGLLFERFTDPDREEYPDIDIDLCQIGRAEVINYVREKYGHVAQIITFGTLKARAAIRDVGRVFGTPLGVVDKLAKLIPEHPKMTFSRALEQEPLLKGCYNDNDASLKQVFGEARPETGEIKRVIDTGMVLEGQVRHAGVHAAGVIVATRPLHEVVPLYKPPSSNDSDVVTQWDGPGCERIGLLKMDFLGLRTLSTIERAKKLIRETLDREEIWSAMFIDRRERMPSAEARAQADPLDLDQFAIDDDRVFSLFRRGETTGVFQFESGGMRRLLMEMKPDRLEDLIAANALFRPGPMDLIPDYNARKHGEQAVEKIHDIVDRFTEETYGIMIYQEQVMQIVHELGGIPLRAAYSLIKAISKKKEKIINAERPVFIAGAKCKGMSEQEAEGLFDKILKFAGYGFNKSHSAGYAIVAYQTALLKTYFPNQYMAAFLSFESQAQKVEDWIRYKDDCKRTRFVNGKVGVDIQPPDINESDADFTVVFDDDEPHTSLNGHVRFGLRALKGAGTKAIDSVVTARQQTGNFRSLHDFCERIPPGTVNKATIEALVCAGAFDSVHGEEQRAAMVASIEGAVAAGQSAAADRAAGQGALFGGGKNEPDPSPTSEPSLVRTAPWDYADMLAKEREVLGFYVSSHPLELHRDAVSRFATADVTAARQMKHDEPIVVGGLVKSVRPVVTRKGDRMAIVTLEDEQNTIDAVLFPRTYADTSAQLVTEAVVLLAGRIDTNRGEPQIIVERAIPIAEADRHLASRVEVVLEDNSGSVTVLDQLAGVLRAAQARTSGSGVPLTITVRSGGRRARLQAERMRISPTPDLIREVEHIAGAGAFRVVGGLPDWLMNGQRDGRSKGRRFANSTASR